MSHKSFVGLYRADLKNNSNHIFQTEKVSTFPFFNLSYVWFDYKPMLKSPNW